MDLLWFGPWQVRDSFDTVNPDELRANHHGQSYPGYSGYLDHGQCSGCYDGNSADVPSAATSVVLMLLSAFMYWLWIDGAH